MNQEQFVNALKRYAADAGAEDTLSQWKLPTGRSPGQKARDQAFWFNGLSKDDKMMVENLAYDAAHSALFGVLCILDGVRRIDPSDDAHFELTRIERGKPQLLSSSHVGASNLDHLHDLL